MTTAIITKYHGPTETRGARVSASWGTDRTSVEYDSTDGLGEPAHRKAAEAVDNAVKPSSTKLKTALDRALDMLGKYQGKKKRAAEAAAQAAREEAARVAAEAEQKR